MKRKPAAASLGYCLEGCMVKWETEWCQQLPTLCHRIGRPLDCPQIRVWRSYCPVWRWKREVWRNKPNSFLLVWKSFFLLTDCSGSEQWLPGGAGAARDRSDLAGASPGTEEPLCQTSGRCVSFAGQMPLVGDVRVVGWTEVQGTLNPSRVPAEGK